MAATDDPAQQRFFHGTRASLRRGDLIVPADPPPGGERGGPAAHVFLTSNLDEAIWDGELAGREGDARVYVVEPLGAVEDAAELPGWKSPGHPTMSRCSREPLRVVGEVTEWPLYHGTRADLQPGDLIEPGYASNYGERAKAAHVYMSRTLDAAAWGAELASGEGPGRIYVVEPTGSIEDDPDLTNKRFPGNPTQSFRSRDALRVTGEVRDWHGHSAEAVAAMKEGIARIERRGRL
jgi:rifampin ADP-ribosylating transferase